MTADEKKALWAAKITTLAEFEHALYKTRLSWPSLSGIRYPNTGGDICIEFEQSGYWWLCREVVRERPDVGLYPPPSSVLVWLRYAGGCGQMFPHVSHEDPKMIAYTPDAQSGQADRQVRTTMGKYLRKYLLLLTDKEIARLEAQHRAELDTSFEMATTVADIERVYNTMSGDTGCMRYEKGHFGHVDYHPSAVYSSPGMGVAYFRDTEGTIKARSVVYVNPDNPNDKRYVRIYGDAVLARKLEANGYRRAALAGTKILKLRDSKFVAEYPNQFVMPYLDPAGGNSAHDNTMNGSHVINVKGSEYLEVIDTETAEKYKAAGINVVGARPTSGCVHVPEVDLSDLDYTCGLTEKTANHLENPAYRWIDENGKLGWALRYNVDRMANLGSLNTMVNGDVALAYCTRDTQKKFGIKRPHYESWFDCHEVKMYLGFVSLDPRYYPDHDYVSVEEVFSLDGENGESVYILKKDAVYVFDVGNNDARAIHSSEAKPLKKAGYITTLTINGVKTLAHKDHARLVTTGSGRRALSHSHAIEQLWDGSWELSRNVEVLSICNMPVSFRKGADQLQIRVPKQDIYDCHRFWITKNNCDRAAYLIDRLARYGGDRFMYFRDNDQLQKGSHFNRGTIEQYREAVAWINSADDAALEAALNWDWKRAKHWAYHAALLLEIHDDQVRLEKFGPAEAAALDYTDHTSPGSAETVAAVQSRAAQQVVEALDELMAIAA